ncbi:MAG: hypothetical protein ABI947_17335 [Chloroflexota bacterium]
MRRSSDGLYNGLTIFFVALTIIICMAVVLFLTKAIPVPVAFAPSSPTLIATRFIPSETPTPTNTLTPIPSETPQPSSTPIPSKTPTPLPDTPVPTVIPDTPLPPTVTNTALPPTKVPPPTRTPTFTKTARPTIDPSLPTLTPRGFPFKIAENTPSLTANLNTAVGCSFEGIGGQVLGLNNEAVANVTIAVSASNGFNKMTTSGSNSRYGESGWEIQVDAQPNTQIYTIELRSDKGVPLSPKVQVAFPGACDRNLALINFLQTRPF